MQSKIVVRYFYSSENKGPKLNLTKDFKKLKKFALISGKELKSLVIRGKDDVKII